MSDTVVVTPLRGGSTLKRLIIGVVLATAAVLGFGLAAPQPAHAATLSSKVDSFVTKYSNKKVGSGQCVALIHVYNQTVLKWNEDSTPGDTGAHEWWDDFGAKAGLSTHYSKVSHTKAAKKGDLAVYSTAVGGGYGHIAIVLKDNGKTLKVFQQNWAPNRLSHVDSTMTKSHLLGYLRPKG